MITPIRGRKRWRLDCIKTNNKIRNDNPDKGTETHLHMMIYYRHALRLEMITPIRGRKQFTGFLYMPKSMD